ncbi:flagella synthesis protein FlgN [Vreelandella jeotgali]|uniref:flagella synthesis protein FlgN n=1 Tax=Vreelandella jeotgali TaxID=553386 RepID=UPI00034D56F2|nr:flagellar protein FlgN [Halomonas jeotgali]
MGLSRLLTDQITRLDQLISLMENERLILTQGDIDGNRLVELADEKQALLEKLDEAEALRRSVQQRLGYDDSADGARRAALDAGCRKDWQALLEKSERVAHLNELSGEMLSLRMNHNQKMLNYIRQVAEKTLYKPDGRNKARPGRVNVSA